MCFEEEVVHLGQLVVVGQGQVQVRRQSDIVGLDAGKGLHRSHPWDLLYFGNWYVLFFVGQDCLNFVLFWLGIDNKVILVV